MKHRLAGQLATGDADDLHPPYRRAEVSQHRPKTLDALVIHKDIGADLQKLVCASGCVLPLECIKCVIIAWHQASVSGCAGCFGRLPTHTVLWAARRWQKDPDPGNAEADIWPVGSASQGMVDRDT